MDRLLPDLVCSARALARSPLVFATAAMTLALGIGSFTGVLAVAYHLLLHPLRYPEPARLVAIETRWVRDTTGDAGVALDRVEEWRRRSRVFAALAGYGDAEVALTGAGAPRNARIAMVTPQFFEVLGGGPETGTTLPISEGKPSAALSAAFVRQLGAPGSWRDLHLTIAGRPFEVSAVLPASFTVPSDRIDAWVSATAAPRITFFSGDDQRRFKLIARLAPGVTLAQAEEDVARVLRELNADVPPRRHTAATVRPLADAVRGDAQRTIWPFVAGAILVLLVSCANVSGLLVGRSVARSREFAVRRALGAGTGDLLRAALGETLLIAFAGWAGGIALAQLVVAAFQAFGDGALPNLSMVRVDGALTAWSLLVAALVALITGVAPAVRALRSDSGAVLKATAQRAGGAGAAGRGVLVSAQIALTVVLLVAAGLLARTVVRIIEAERGFEVENTLAMRLMLAETVRYNAIDRTPLVEGLLSEVRAIPGVLEAGIGSDLPPGGTQIMMTIRVVAEGRDEISPLSFATVTPGYLEALGAKLLKGRLLRDEDRNAEIPAVVITAAAAGLLGGSEDPVGREWLATIPNPGGKQVRPRVVGVIGDIKFRGLDRAASPGLFTTWERMAPSQSFLLVRTSGDARPMMAAIRDVVHRAAPALPRYPLEPLEDVVKGTMADRRLRLQLAATFAALSLLLAAIAIGGAVAQHVLDRRRELAIRMALGSTAAGAVKLIVRRGVWLTFAGVVAGVCAAAAAARALQHLLHEVTPLDPLTFGAAVCLAAAVAMLGCYVPARRAAAISPAELLRES